MDVISLHSRVAWGYVGNSAAVPVLQSLGINAWPIDTVTLAHHPGHGPVEKHLTPPNVLAQTFQDVRARLKTAAILIGYLGSAEQGDAVLSALNQSRSCHPVFVDPVIGDDAEGVYVPTDVVTFFRDRALPVADVVMPNRFELSLLSGYKILTINDAIDAARSLMQSSVAEQTYVVSSIPGNAGHLQTAVITDTSIWSVETPAIALKAKGTGDILAAAYIACTLSHMRVADTLSRAVSITDATVRRAHANGASELDIPSLMDEIRSAPNLIPAIRYF